MKRLSDERLLETMAQVHREFADKLISAEEITTITVRIARAQLAYCEEQVAGLKEVSRQARDWMLNCGASGVLANTLAEQDLTEILVGWKSHWRNMATKQRALKDRLHALQERICTDCSHINAIGYTYCICCLHGRCETAPQSWRDEIEKVKQLLELEDHDAQD